MPDQFSAFKKKCITMYSSKGYLLQLKIISVYLKAFSSLATEEIYPFYMNYRNAVFCGLLEVIFLTFYEMQDKSMQSSSTSMSNILMQIYYAAMIPIEHIYPFC